MTKPGGCVHCGGPAAIPCSKRCRICHLLDQWDVIWDPSVTSPQGSPGDGSGIGLMPHMSRHASVRELVACLLVLRSVAPIAHSHLMAFHGAEWRIAHVPKVDTRGKVVLRLDGFGKWVPDTDPRRQRVVPSWVRMDLVRQGQDAIVQAFRGKADLPVDLLEALTLSSEDANARAARRRSRNRAAA